MSNPSAFPRLPGPWASRECGWTSPRLACFVDAIGVVNVEASGRSEHSGVAGGFASISVGGFIIRTEVSFYLRNTEADLANGEHTPE